MATGLQGAFEVFKNVTQSIFVCDTNDAAAVTINVCNRGVDAGKIQIAVTANQHEIQETDAILEWDLDIIPKQVIERTGIIVPSNYFLTIKSTCSPLSVQAWGMVNGNPITVSPTSQNLGLAPVWNTTNIEPITGILNELQFDITDEGPVDVRLTSGTLLPGLAVAGEYLTGTLQEALDNIPGDATQIDFLLDSPGDYTFTVPTGNSLFTNMSAVVVGGGGGGGGGDNTDYGAGGGGGGGLAYVNNVTLTGGEVIQVVVGDGGNGVKNGYGSAGEASSLKIDSVTVLTGGAGQGGYIGGNRDGFNNFTTYQNQGTFSANASYGTSRGGGNGGGSGGNYNGAAGGGGAGGFDGNGARGPHVQNGSGYELATGTGAGGGGGWNTFPAAGDGSEDVAGVAGGQGGYSDDSSAGGGGGGSYLWNNSAQTFTGTIVATAQNGERRDNKATNTNNGHGGNGGFPGGGGGGGSDEPGYASYGGKGGRGAARIVFSNNSFDFPTNTNADFSTRYVFTNAQSYSTSSTPTTVTLTARDEVGNETPTAFSIVRKWQDGSTEALAAPSAKEIKRITGTNVDGTYWIKPEGTQEAFQLHCYMDSVYDGGGWMLVLRNDSNITTNNGFGSGAFLVANWEGWGYSTKEEIDALGYDYSTQDDSLCFAPTYALCPFNDVMVIASRSGQQDKRVGWRHTSQFENMYSVINQPNTYKADVVLFGNAYNWLSELDVQSDTNVMEPNNDFVGFKIRSDTGSTSNSSNYTGGFFTSSMHYGSQIGCGRDNSNSNVWGGGFGGEYANSGRWHRMHGHWWNHSDQRFSGSDRTQVFYGHGVYIR